MIPPIYIKRQLIGLKMKGGALTDNGDVTDASLGSGCVDLAPKIERGMT